MPRGRARDGRGPATPPPRYSSGSGILASRSSRAALLASGTPPACVAPLHHKTEDTAICLPRRAQRESSGDPCLCFCSRLPQCRSGSCDESPHQHVHCRAVGAYAAGYGQCFPASWSSHSRRWLPSVSNPRFEHSQPRSKRPQPTTDGRCRPTLAARRRCHVEGDGTAARPVQLLAICIFH